MRLSARSQEHCWPFPLEHIDYRQSILTWSVNSFSFTFQVRHLDIVNKFNWFVFSLLQWFRLALGEKHSRNSSRGNLLLVLPPQISNMERISPLSVMAKVAVIMRVVGSPYLSTIGARFCMGTLGTLFRFCRYLV